MGHALVIAGTPSEFETYRHHLESEDFEVSHVTSADAALPLSRSLLFDVVLHFGHGETEAASLSLAFVQKVYPEALHVQLPDPSDPSSFLDISCRGNVERLSCPLDPAIVVAKIAALNRFKERTRLLEDENQRLRREAVVDDLTGIPNRRFLSRQIEHELARSMRYTHTFSFLLLDLDNFKLVNDQYGHQCGDRVLVQVARILSGSVRAADTVARYGGDEFAILLLGTDMETGARVAERLRQEVVERALTGMAECTSVSLTASVGLCSYPRNPISSFQNLVTLADAALYSAKRSGGNRIAFVQDPGTPEAN